MLWKILQYSATIRDGCDDDSDSGGGSKKTVAIVAHRRGTCPSDETGEGIRKEILNLHTLWARAVVLTEAEWRGVYQKVVNDLIAYDKEMLAKRQAAQAAAPATEETKEEKAEEKVEETK